MWKYQLIVLVALLAGINQVNSACEQIGLDNCECQYPKAKRYEVDCQSKGLSALPEKKDYILKSGDVSGNFSYNSVEEIPDFYFAKMRYFDILDFTSNRISEINTKSLTGLQSRLTTLILKENRIKSIPEATLSEYIRLDKLDLSSNKINSPCGIDTADVVTYSLANNGIASLEDSCFSESTQVQSLDLSRNEIKSISSQAFLGMSSLVNLDLGYNQLTEDVGDGLEALIDIESFAVLSLSGNNLAHIGSICDIFFKNIESIDFGYNELIDIQKYCFSPYANTGSGPDLTLNFEHNRITVISGTSLAGLAGRLKQLKLNHNRISEVNVNAFKDLRKLAYLDLSNNQISSLEFLRNWEENSLQELSIANNLIVNLSPKVFGKMLKLTKLSLDGNLMLNIDAAAFQGMVVLEDLSLQYNLLTNLADGAFEGLDQLKKLRLRGNALVTLKNCTFANLERLVLFHFDDNLIHCDCDLLWLIPFMSAINVKGIRDLTVAEPVLEDRCYYPTKHSGEDLVNTVSYKCDDSTANACFGLAITYEDPVEEAMNVSWSWDTDKADSAIDSIELSHVDVETDRLVTNASIKAISPPYTLRSIQEDKVYKVMSLM